MLSYLVAFASDPALVNERQRYSAFTQGIRKLGIHPILVDTAVAVQVPGRRLMGLAMAGGGSNL